MISNSFTVNENGHLAVGGADTVALAKEFGTPLYVFDEGYIRNTIKEFQKAFSEFYNGNALVLYASKAFSCKEIYRIMSDLGAGVDVVSGGELYTALQTGFNPANIYFHGNNKTPDEIELAIKNKVGHIVIDNLDELEKVDRIATAHGIVQPVMLRVKPGIDVHTHDYIRTGQIDSKFGFALETGEAAAAAKKAAEYANLNLIGIHAHIGSQIFELQPFRDCAVILMQFIKSLSAEGITITELNLGGGYGIKYTEADDPHPFRDFIEQIADAVKAFCSENSMPDPRLLIEPGRSVVAPAGLTLYTVGSVKEIPNIRTYVSVDGGMTDNPRYILYGSKYDLLIANKATEPKTHTVTVAGKCCESGDLIQENAPIQSPEAGDVLAVLATGAYNYSMASNYNRIPRPAAVMVRDGEARLIIKRESYENLVQNDI